MEVFNSLLGDSVIRLPSRDTPRLSTLTRDGVPLELSLSLSRDGAGGLRYAVDTAAGLPSLRGRIARSLRAVSEVAARLGLGDAASVHAALCDAAFPEELRARDDVRFACWHGMVHRPDRPDVLKVYYNLRLLRGRSLTHVSRAADALAPRAERGWFARCVELLPRAMRPAYFGVEFSSVRGRAKLYALRSSDERVGVDDLRGLVRRVGLGAHDDALSTFLDRIRSRSAAPAEARCVHVGEEDGRPIAAAYFDADPDATGDDPTRDKLHSMLSALGVDPTRYHTLFEAVLRDVPPPLRSGHHTLVGVGVGPSGLKINLYMQPTMESLRAISGV